MSGEVSLPQNIRFDLKPEQANEMFLRPLFVSDSILGGNPAYRVLRNVKREVNMYLLGEMEEIIQQNTGCGWTPKGKMPSSQRKLIVKKHKVNLELCTDEFWDTCFEHITGEGLDIHKLDSTELGRQVLNFWIMRIQQGVKNDMFVIGWYSDTNSNIPFLAQNDGWLKRIEADVAAGDTPPTIPTGSGAALAAGASETIFAAMIDAQTDELEDIDESNKQFLVSKSVWKNYRAFLKSNPNLESDRIRLIEGIEELTYCGIPVVKCPKFDKTDTNKLGNADTHRAILVWNGNLAVGTDVNGADTSFNIRFDEDTELHKIKSFFRLGFQVALPELIVYAK